MIEIIYDPEVLMKKISSRSSLDNPEVLDTVMHIMGDIRRLGDEALKEYTLKFDNCNIDEFQVSKAEIDGAYEEIKKDFLEILREAIINIREYHEKQKLESWLWEKAPGVTLGQKITAIESVGIYVPGGTAPLVSTVLMNAVPASVAGVKNIIMCTPPGSGGKIDAERLVAAKEAGVTEIYKVGGAQAIFAMAFGTESIPRVDKITGPGNIYVANAKKLAYGYCGIDMIAGPSEILIIADDNANPAYAAADLLSQAEHDEQAAAILITESIGLARRVQIELDKQIALLPRKSIASKSIGKYGAIYIAADKWDAVDIANRIAPEHCELLTDKPEEYEKEIINAGAIFVGEYSPEPLGDYWAGPNHILPTGGTARFYSPLGTYDFYKRTNIIKYDRAALLKDYRKIKAFAEEEKLEAHAKAVAIRFMGEQHE